MYACTTMSVFLSFYLSVCLSVCLSVQPNSARVLLLFLFSICLQGEMGWISTTINVDEWLKYYSSRRYGAYSPLTEKAWAILKTSAYSHHWSWNIKSIVDRAPGFGMTTDTGFNASGLVEAWTLLYKAGDSGQVDPAVGPYQYDLVDIGRQCLVDLFFDFYSLYSVAYNRHTKSGVNTTTEMVAISSEMEQLLMSLDEYLGTNTNFLLGHWIADARNSTPNNASSNIKDNCEFNARNQITMWGPHQNIEDYASKEWSGLIKDYYLQRWTLFLNTATLSVKMNKKFDNTVYQADRFKFEEGFSYTVKSYPTEPQGDVMKMTKTLLDKYTSQALQKFSTVDNTDSPGSDVYLPWSKNIGEVAYLCYIDSSCVGFNSNGYMKNSTTNRINSPGTVLYTKT